MRRIPMFPFFSNYASLVVDHLDQAGGKYKETPVGGDSVFATVSLGGKTYQVNIGHSIDEQLKW